jgi:AraC-like DNA-binding protein
MKRKRLTREFKREQGASPAAWQRAARGQESGQKKT